MKGFVLAPNHTRLAAIIGVALQVVAGLVFATPLWTEDTKAAEPREAAVHAVGGEIVGFREQIVPLLTKLGCNAGACHGAAAGRGGMALSLFGSRPASDYEEIVVDLQGRRVHRLVPSKSLLLAKPSGLIEHEGGVLIEQGDESWRAIEAWMLAGCPDSQPAPLQSLELKLKQKDDCFSYQVVATDVAGKSLDVTSLAAISADQPEGVKIDPMTRTLVFRQPGIQALVARYRDRIAVVQHSTPFSDPINAGSLDESTSAKLDERRIEHGIDRIVRDRLQRLNLPLQQRTDEPTFLRRLYIDLIGRLPTVSECKSYYQSSESNKRDLIVDRLLQSEEFVQFQLFQWAKRLGLRSQPNDKGEFQTHLLWLENAIREDVPIPQMASEIVMALGDSRTVGATYFTRSYPDPKLRADAFGRFFLGIQLSCAQCHDHPLDRWTQDDFHGFAAIFAKTLPEPTLRFDPAGQIIHVGKKQIAAPSVPGEPNPIPDSDPRPALAEWLKRDNRLLAQSQVNWVWSELMGSGLVEPIDAITPTRPGDYPVLFDHLTDYFIQNGYRMKPLIRYLITSQTYASAFAGGDLSAEQASLCERFYARAAKRPFGAEVYGISIQDLARYYANPSETNTARSDRFTQWVDGNTRSESLELLGRCSRQDSCSSSSASASTLRRELHLMNSSFLDEAIGAVANGWQVRLESGVALRSIIDEFHQIAFQRPMLDAEWQGWAGEFMLNDPIERRQRWEDYIWSILVSQPFRNR